MIFNIIGVILIVLIIWWFFYAKQKSIKASGEVIEIKVQNGVYAPAVIEAQKGQTLTLRFMRKDETPCSEIVKFEDFGVSSELPINKPHDIKLQLKKTGEFNFTCQMGMYQGKIIVN